MSEASKPTILPRVKKAKAVAQTANTSETGVKLPRPNKFWEKLSTTTMREYADAVTVIRNLSKKDGPLSAAVFSFVQVANSGFKIQAYDTMTHEFSSDGTLLARAVMASMDTLNDYSQGFVDKDSVPTLVTKALREVTLTGALAAELVLDKQRWPDRIQVIAYETIDYKSAKDGLRFPVQSGGAGGEDVELNFPTFFIAHCQDSADSNYATPMMEASLDYTDYYKEFLEDMRRVLKVAGQPRADFKLISEMVNAAMPDDYKADPKKARTYMEQTLTDVQTMVNNLSPEDAVVHYDYVEVDVLRTEGEKADYKDLMAALAGLLSTSMKTHPSILGLRLAGSQSLSNTESLVFLKMARAIQEPVEVVVSRALTLAARLHGADIYVKFRFDAIDLRPESELEAFRTMKQQRVIELLSMGQLTDDEAAIELGTFPRPAGAPDHSGTMFHMSMGNTGIDASKASPNTDSMGAALQPSTPSKAGGKSQ